MAQGVAPQLAPPSAGECERVLQQVKPALSGQLFAFVPQGERLATARPVLELVVQAENKRPMDEERVTATLSAFAVLARFAQRFNGVHLVNDIDRKRKMAFWLCVLSSNMMHRGWASKEDWQPETLAPLVGRNISLWMLDEPTFPKLAVKVELQSPLDPELDLKLAAFAMTAGRGRC